ncbi:conserved hypothetical protein [Coccidioides posadasii str. Silveira]|uniref:Uncharacterized protein n=2 Tax=Coccidioides posadasii TaxID=199306 RepID=E9D875_COCPS|nr:conserved hypothetical protein [Coccidioides posadasii str. Silveira]KMM70773.1 hypothetical protein CPAG_07084 [Coccidioides posadasii RMSCC 3488]
MWHTKSTVKHELGILMTSEVFSSPAPIVSQPTNSEIFKGWMEAFTRDDEFAENPWSSRIRTATPAPMIGKLAPDIANRSMALKRGPTCEKPLENQTWDGAHVKEPQTRPSGTYKKMKRRGRFPTGSRKMLSLGIIQDL